MFARLTIGQVKPDKINETTKLYEESVFLEPDHRRAIMGPI
jgi:hypothetical protein